MGLTEQGVPTFKRLGVDPQPFAKPKCRENPRSPRCGSPQPATDLRGADFVSDAIIVWIDGVARAQCANLAGGREPVAAGVVAAKVELTLREAMRESAKAMARMQATDTHHRVHKANRGGGVGGMGGGGCLRGSRWITALQPQASCPRRIERVRLAHRRCGWNLRKNDLLEHGRPPRASGRRPRREITVATSGTSRRSLLKGGGGAAPPPPQQQQQQQGGLGWAESADTENKKTIKLRGNCEQTG